MSYYYLLEYGWDIIHHRELYSTHEKVKLEQKKILTTQYEQLFDDMKKEKMRHKTLESPYHVGNSKQEVDAANEYWDTLNENSIYDDSFMEIFRELLSDDFKCYIIALELDPNCFN